MTQIHKVLITEFGDESKLAVVAAELPEPKAGEVQVEVEYSVVAGADVNMRRGTYPFQRKAPLTPGYSVIGRVARNGAGCSKFAAGARVACLTKYDGQAERVNLPERFLVPVPDDIDLRQAVALILDWTTAYQMIHRTAQIRRGQRTFVHGLSGGVGRALLALGKLEGAEIFGTASSGKHEELRRLGAMPFDYRNKQWIGAVRQAGGVDCVFDPLGFESFDESYGILRRGGLLVGYGMNLRGFEKAERRSVLPTMLKLMARNLAFWSGKRTRFYGVARTSKTFAPDLELLFAWLKAGKITVPIKGVFPMREIQLAHREYESSAGMGSIILAIGGS